MNSPSPLIRRLDELLAKSDKPTLRYKPLVDASWTYVTGRQYMNRIFSVAQNLYQLGIEPGQRIFIHLETCIEWDLLEKASMHLGLELVALEPYAPKNVIEQTILKTRPRLVFTERSELFGFLDEQPHYSRVIAKTNSAEWASVFEQKSVSAVNLSRDQQSFIDRPAYLVMTSGSTSEPRFIAYTQGQIFDAVSTLVRHLQPASQSQRVLSWLPLANLFQRMTNWSGLFSQAEIYFWSKPELVMTALAKVRPTVFIGVPRFYEKLTQGHQQFASRFPWLPKALLFSAFGLYLRRHFGASNPLLISGSAALKGEVETHFLKWNLPILQAYGLSECLLPIAMSTLTSRKTGSVGKLVTGNEVRISKTNEVEIRGQFVFSGYADRPHSSDSWTEDGYFRTNDFATLDDDGFLFLKGRGSSRIKLSTGRRIQREELEQSVPIPSWGNRVLLFGQDQPSLVALVDINQQSSPSNEQINSWKISMCQWNSNRMTHEKVRGALIIGHPFSPGSGELTLNLKVKYNVLEKKYGELISILQNEVVRRRGRSKDWSDFRDQTATLVVFQDQTELCSSGS